MYIEKFTDDFGNIFEIEMDDVETKSTETERVFSEDEIEYLKSLGKINRVITFDDWSIEDTENILMQEFTY